jgi:imidazolonepropionase-like amidohydrolase
MNFRQTRSVAMCAIAIATSALAPFGPSRAADVANDVFFDDVRVFDGQRTHAKRDVLVRDGRIVAIGATLKAPAGVQRIDGVGKTLLPGFIDAHTHSWGDARNDALRFGVTAELDMLGDWQRLPQLKRERESLDRTAQADLWTAGAAVTAPKGHGTQYGMNVPTLAADGDPAAFVRARIGEGSDYIKIILEDFSSHHPTQRWPTITHAQAKQAIAAAHRDGRLAVVHVAALADGRAVVDGGADGLVHIFTDEADEAFVRAAKQRKTFVIPTLSVIATMAQAGEGRALSEDARLSPWLSGTQSESLRAVYPGSRPRPEKLDRALRTVRALHEAGVDILAGTDAGNPGTTHGASLHGELALLVRAGMTPTQALAAATSVPARRFGLKDRGRIAAGARADVVLVDGDPTQDITATRAIVGVWKNGYALERPRQGAASAAPQGAALPAERLIDDFAGQVAANAQGMLPAKFGAGWMQTTDQMAGGASTVALERADGRLKLTGEVKTGFAFPWSGVMFFPAAAPMQPVDFTGRSELTFKARGDGRSYNVMLFSGQQAQAMPSIRPFVATAEWTEVRIPLSGFVDGDLARVRGIAFTAGQPVGTFAFEIDDVEVK